MKTAKQFYQEKKNYSDEAMEGIDPQIIHILDEYANQSKAPIEFAEWIAENNYRRYEVFETVGTDNVEYRWTDAEYLDEYTTEQLYEKFKGVNSITPKKQGT